LPNNSCLFGMSQWHSWLINCTEDGCNFPGITATQSRCVNQSLTIQSTQSQHLNFCTFSLLFLLHFSFIHFDHHRVEKTQGQEVKISVTGNMESKLKPLRNIKLRMITLQSNISDWSNLCWYACCFELVRGKRTPNRALKVVEGCVLALRQSERCAVASDICWKLLELVTEHMVGRWQ